jgi:gliding motility-associated-like protein
MFTVYVPTAFTPNEDLRNEVFGPVGMGIKWYNMKIFTRWGEMVYETQNSQAWNGLYNGRVLPEGVYPIQFEMRDYKNKRHYYSGTVHLLK